MLGFKTFYNARRVIIGIELAQKIHSRPPLHPDTVSAAQKLIEAGLTPGEAAKQLGIGRATAYRIARALH